MNVFKRFINLTFMALALIGCSSDDVKFFDGEKKIWELSGYTIDQAKEFKRIGVAFQEATQWKNLGFSIEDVKKWKSSGYESSEAGKWKRASFTLNEANAWQKFGYSAHDASSWRGAGYDIGEANQWKQEGFDLRLSQLWKSNGFDLNQSKELVAIGFERQRAIDAKCYMDKGFSVADIKDLKTKDIDCGNASKWKTDGFTANEIVMATGGGYDKGTGYSELKTWRDAGFSIDESLQLRKYNFRYSNIDSFKKLRDSGYKVDELAELTKSEKGLWEAEKWNDAKIEKGIAKSWLEKNITFTEAQNWIAINVSPEDATDYKSKGQTYIDVKKNKQSKIEESKVAESQERKSGGEKVDFTANKQITPVLATQTKYDSILANKGFKDAISNYDDVVRTNRMILDYFNLLINRDDIIALSKSGELDRDKSKFLLSNADVFTKYVHCLIAKHIIGPMQPPVQDAQVVYITGVIKSPKALAARNGPEYEMEKMVLRKFPLYALWEKFREPGFIKNITDEQLELIYSASN
jgi:hypothetical protein